MVTNIERLVYHRFARPVENIAIVSESIVEDPNVLSPRRSQEQGLLYGTLRRILHLHLHLYLYKVQHKQHLKPSDHSQIRKYVEWVFAQQVVDGNFSNKIFIRDEAHFPLVGYVHKQNCCICDSENPQVIEERPLHPEKVTVW